MIQLSYLLHRRESFIGHVLVLGNLLAQTVFKTIYLEYVN
jgi:hypothetical protein